MIRIYLFIVTQVAVSAYALWRGGAPERWVAAAMLAAMAVTAVLPRAAFRDLNLNLLLVDLALFGLILAVALRADRFWPLWLAALQLITLGVHGVRAYDQQILPVIYNRTVGELAYPMLVLLVAGTLRHRARLRDRGSDRSWSDAA